MGFTVGYQVVKSEECSQPKCKGDKAGGTISLGQLKLFAEDGEIKHSRHLECISRGQRRTVAKKYKNALNVPGYQTLRPADKSAIAEWFNEEQGTGSITGERPDQGVSGSSVPAPSPFSTPAVGTESVSLMRLELEDKEAELRLAEAEFSLAETRVRVETARRAVVAQRLTMARAGIIS